MFEKLKSIFSINKKELCVYCFEYFNLSDTPFRCNNDKCPKETDNIYKEYWGDSKAKGRVIKNSDNVKKKKCDKCNQVTFKRLCPHCHQELPRFIGEAKNKIFSIIGAPSVGKSHFIAVLINELDKKIGPNMNLLLDALDDQTRERYRKNFYKPIYRNHEIVRPTESNDIDNRLPLIYNLSLIRNNKIIDYITLVFFDTAGENLKSQDTMSLVNKYIYRSDGIILLIDPLQIPLVRNKLGNKVPIPEEINNNTEDISNYNPKNILSRVTSLIEQGKNLSAKDKIDIPLAISFTKLDVLDSIISDDYQIKYPSNHEKGFDIKDFNAINQEMKTLLKDWDEEGLVNLANAKYKKVGFFGLSALGCNPHKNKKIPAVNPIRIEDPFLWLLYVNNFIKAKK